MNRDTPLPFGGFAPSSLAQMIARSEKFQASPSEKEKVPVFNRLEDDLIRFVENSVFHLSANNDDYWEAAKAVEEAITALLTDCILEALFLANVTDPALMAELCRCVIKGGKPFDGHGFGTVLPSEEAKAGRVETPEEHYAARRAMDEEARRRDAA